MVSVHASACPVRRQSLAGEGCNLAIVERAAITIRAVGHHRLPIGDLHPTIIIAIFITAGLDEVGGISPAKGDVATYHLSNDSDLPAKDGDIAINGRIVLIFTAECHLAATDSDIICGKLAISFT